MIRYGKKSLAFVKKLKGSQLNPSHLLFCNDDDELWVVEEQLREIRSCQLTIYL